MCKARSGNRRHRHLSRCRLAIASCRCDPTDEAAEDAKPHSGAHPWIRTRVRTKQITVVGSGEKGQAIQICLI
jgi:hypothetical protein